jgi:SpoVK/Ycf46/Vps4 family AAA+-type ATPase
LGTDQNRTADEQGALWRSLLAAPPMSIDEHRKGETNDPDRGQADSQGGSRANGEAYGHIDEMVAQFNLSVPAIRHSVSLAFTDAESDEPPDKRLWNACRAQARMRLDDLARRIEPAADWDDLVVPEPEKRLLHDIAVQVARRATVYTAWGFAHRTNRGLGISALFVGPSGTGKTMASEVLAQTLRLDLYHIDLAGIVSKYIGETEKNLRRVFDAAEDSGAILFFDEADALFGKRSEVKDSHDRYANIEVSYLLQRMEAYRGLAVLATNNKSAVDTAFLRRIRFVVNFPFPDARQRAEIWRRVFPASTPTDGLDVARLARLNVAGGNIRNIALNAAFHAADAGEPVRMAHILRAARAEFAKLDKPLTEIGIRDQE